VERAAGRALSIFTNPLSARILRAHSRGALSTRELEELLAWAPESSLRTVGRRLCAQGVLTEARPPKGPCAAAFELTPAGHELLAVADALERWLADAPRGPLSLDDPAAQGTVRVLTAAWESNVVRTLAEQPYSLGEINQRIAEATYPSLKRRVAKLHSTGLVAAASSMQGARFAATDWLRLAVVPLMLAARWERRYDASATPLTCRDAEAAFLLALPLVTFPEGATGTCAFAVLIPASAGKPARQVAGVTLEIRGGELVACKPCAVVEPKTWALGDPNAWFAAIVDGDVQFLRIKGADQQLATGLVGRLHELLFAERSERLPTTRARTADTESVR
jgi:DNA-binding HxlR family transcriptional regulator